MFKYLILACLFPISVLLFVTTVFAFEKFMDFINDFTGLGQIKKTFKENCIYQIVIIFFLINLICSFYGGDNNLIEHILFFISYLIALMITSLPYIYDEIPHEDKTSLNDNSKHGWKEVINLVKYLHNIFKLVIYKYSIIVIFILSILGIMLLLIKQWSGFICIFILCISIFIHSKESNKSIDQLDKFLNDKNQFILASDFSFDITFIFLMMDTPWHISMFILISLFIYKRLYNLLPYGKKGLNVITSILVLYLIFNKNGSTYLFITISLFILATLYRIKGSICKDDNAKVNPVLGGIIIFCIFILAIIFSEQSVNISTEFNKIVKDSIELFKIFLTSNMNFLT